MNHYRCSRCKEEVGIRHKRFGGLLCEPCLQSLSAGRRRGIFSWFKDLLHDVVEWFKDTFSSKQQQSVFDEKAKVSYATQKAKSLSIPTDPGRFNPQKR